MINIKKIINKYLTINTVTLSIVIIFCMSIIVDSFFSKINKKEQENFEVPILPEGLPHLPIVERVSNNYCKGFVADVCNSKITQPPFLITQNFEDITIEGWAINIDKNEELKALYLEYNGRIIPAQYNDFRPDVKKQIGLNGSAFVGFKITIEQDSLNLEGNSNIVRFWGVDKDSTCIFPSNEYKLIFPVQKPSENYVSNKDLTFAVTSVANGLSDNTLRTLIIEESPYTTIKGELSLGALPVKTIYMGVNGITYLISYKQKTNSSEQHSESNRYEFETCLPSQAFSAQEINGTNKIEFIVMGRDNKLYTPIKYSIIKEK